MNYRQELLLQGCQLFAANGYDAIGVQEIVTAVGVTKPTLYHYFGSKAGLLQAIFSSHLDPFNQKLSSLAAYNHDIVLSLENITRHYFQVARAEPAFFRLWMTVRLAPIQSAAHKLLLPFSQSQEQTLVRFFEAASRQHGNLRTREQHLAISFTGMLYIFASQALQERQDLDQELVYRSVHQFMYGIFS